jgi:hypothetical protein
MDVVPTEQFAVHPSVICRELSGETVLLNLVSGVYLLAARSLSE